MSLAPGVIRDSIISFLDSLGGDASTEEIVTAVKAKLGETPKSSVRSYLALNTPNIFERTARGRYRLQGIYQANGHASDHEVNIKSANIGNAQLHNADCFEWLMQQKPASVQAIVTDPPYGLVEYTAKETAKLRSGKGGIWRIPPAFDGHQRAPLPRFTVLSDQDRLALHAFFLRFGRLAARIVVPGANIVIASNPLLAHIVADAMTQSGLELRGYVARQVMTMRGGDRPKNAHHEFSGVSVMPRSQWEPWVVLRAPLEGRVQDNLRKWKTGGFRRPSDERPFGDVIRSHPTPAGERKIAPHPSLKPQAFMRQLVRAVLPLGEGTILDPFMGAGSTLAAANALGYKSTGIELDKHFFELAKSAIPQLAEIAVKHSDSDLN
ncbi:DNA-methyltransferase [Pseudomonas chlororaphis]|uniref:Methyltransferase n=1 Tax=Pseudomonas chlororaphis TaxID=587753 RepID=A0AAP9VYR3_9PSED|nr:DNA methyltransferase [Pseudomonas chlororaphis]QNR50177.1 site-specific DNA-methyltransferase [Pseudomonas chlororaphis]